MADIKFDWAQAEYGAGKLRAPAGGVPEDNWIVVFRRRAWANVEGAGTAAFRSANVNRLGMLIVTGIVGSPEALLPHLDEAAAYANAEQSRLGDRRQREADEAEREADRLRQRDEEITRRIRATGGSGA